MASRPGWSSWGSDTAVSRPVPPGDDVPIDFGGFGFTGNGFVHNLTEVDREVMFTPPYSPRDSDG